MLDEGDGAGIEGARLYAVEAFRGALPISLIGGQIVSSDLSRPVTEPLSVAAARSGELGDFSMLASGRATVRLVAYHPRYQPWESGPIEMPPAGGSLSIECELKRGATMVGAVLVSERTELDPRKVRIVSAEPGPLPGTRQVDQILLDLDDALDFRARGLADGVYIVEVYGTRRGGPDGRLAMLASETVVIEGDEQVDVPILIGHEMLGFALRGRVRVPDNWGGAEVWAAGFVDPPPAPPVRTVPLDDEGRFCLTDILDRKVMIVVLGFDESESRLVYACRMVTLESGDGSEIVIDASRPVVEGRTALEAWPARVRVAGSTEHPMFDAAFDEMSLKSDVEGRFVVYGLPDGDYRFSVDGRPPIRLRIERASAEACMSVDLR